MDSKKKKVAMAGPLKLVEPPRRAYVWIFVPSVVIILLGLLWVASSEATWRFVGSQYIQIYYAIQALTAVACFFYGVAILVLNRAALSSPEDWLRFIGWAFFTMFVMYFLGFSLEALHLDKTLWGGISAKQIVFSFFSAANNLLFLAAAFKLVNRPPFPAWSIAVQFGSWAFGTLLYILHSTYNRVPGVLASAFCILWLGYALYVNIADPDTVIRTTTYLSNSLRRDLKRLVLAGVTFYFMFEIAFALNPLLAQGQPSQVPSLLIIQMSMITSSPKQEKRVAATASQEAAQATHSPAREDAGRLNPLPVTGNSVMQTTQDVTLEEFEDMKLRLLDTGVFFALFGLKFVIFIAVFLLLLEAIIFLSAKSESAIFKPILEADGEFLTNSGITKSIADAVGATSVKLFIRVPGKEKKEYAKFQWPPPEGRDVVEKIFENQIPEFVLTALQTGQEQKHSNQRMERSSLRSYFPFAGELNLPEKIAEPIKYHGAVIGCLSVRGRSTLSLSRTAVQRIRDLAKFVTLEVQSYREAASLEQLGFRFSRLLIGPEPIGNFKSSIVHVVKCLQDVLSPLATSLWIDIGLQNLEHKAYAGDESYCAELQRRLESQSPTIDNVEIIEIPLGVKRKSGDDEVLIGKLTLLVPSGKDHLQDPILGRNEMYQRTVIARTVDMLIVLTQEYLTNQLQTFGIGLNQGEPIGTPEWFDWVKNTASTAGVEWVVADLRKENRLFTTTSPIAAVEELRARIDSRQGSEYPYPLSPTLDNADHFVCYHRADLDIYFGVRSTSYSNKLAVPMWMLFLDRFADLAHSTLERIQADRLREQHLQSEAEFAHKAAKHDHELANVGAMIGEMTHQISNTARAITEPVRMHREALATGDITCASKEMALTIERLPEVTDQLLVWTASFNKLSTLSECRPCNLQQAASQSRILYGMFLDQRSAILDIDIDPSIEVDMPPPVVTLAIANLVGNSKEVIRPGGLISITATVEGDDICCLVTDNGTGIPSHIERRLFDPNVTTKSNGGGWGLHLTRFSLEGYKGSIDLIQTSPKGTTFRIRFPKYKRLEIDKETV